MQGQPKKDKKNDALYMHIDDDLSGACYIDDTSLYVYFLLLKGIFSTNKSTLAFLYLRPFEWSDLDFTRFVLKAAEDYGVQISGGEVVMGAVEDDSEVAVGEYDPAYNWYISQPVDTTNPEVLLLRRVEQGRLDFDSIKSLTAIAYSSKHVFAGSTEAGYVNQLAKRFMNYTSFEISLSAAVSKDLQEAFDKYLLKYREGGLAISRQRKVLKNVYVAPPKNIASYEAQRSKMLSYLADMQSLYGNEFTIQNPFEDDYPADDNVSAELIKRRYSSRDFLFFHTLFSLQAEGLIEIERLSNSWEFFEDKNQSYECRVSLLKTQPAAKSTAFELGANRRLAVAGSGLYLGACPRGNVFKLLKLLLQSDGYYVDALALKKQFSSGDAFSSTLRKLKTYIEDIATIKHLHEGQDQRVVTGYQLVKK